MDMTTPEEMKLALKILSKHTGISEADLDYKNEVEIIRPSEAEAAMREYGELKQSPRWVKAADEELMKLRIKAERGEVVTEKDLYEVQMMLYKSLDESGSPEPEAVDPDFTLWVVVNKWQYHEGKHRWLNDYIAECNGMRLTHEELYNLFKQTQ